MSAKTSIEWTDYSWSPWWGCTPVSPGCAHCYAANWAKYTRGLEYRRGVPRQKTKDWQKPRTLNRKAADLIEKPRIFPSMCDIFDEEVPDSWRREFFDLVYETRNLCWLVLTKRPYVAREFLLGKSWAVTDPESFRSLWPNLWLGVSAETQLEADNRIPVLLDVPAVVRFVSVEPMLGPVSLAQWLPDGQADQDTTAFHNFEHPKASIHWVIYGGESGRGARPCNVDWLRWGAVECQSAGVPVFLKQLGSRPFYANEQTGSFRTEHSKGGNLEEWPSYMPRLRQFPLLT